MIRLALLTFLLLTVTASWPQKKSPEDQTPPAALVVVKVPDLTQHPERYDGTIVKVRGEWFSGYHISLLCPIGNNRNCIQVTLDCPTDADCRTMQRMLKNNLHGDLDDLHVTLTVVGKFEDLKETQEYHLRFVLRVRKISL